jgi:hypothetical protein
MVGDALMFESEEARNDIFGCFIKVSVILETKGFEDLFLFIAKTYEILELFRNSRMTMVKRFGFATNAALTFFGGARFMRKLALVNYFLPKN